MGASPQKSNVRHDPSPLIEKNPGQHGASGGGRGFSAGDGKTPSQERLFLTVFMIINALKSDQLQADGLDGNTDKSGGHLAAG